jgi:hypothetical protein
MDGIPNWRHPSLYISTYDLNKQAFSSDFSFLLLSHYGNRRKLQEITLGQTTGKGNKSKFLST